ncbi:MAG: winged helix-turn-helix domain-containing protein [Acidimicrobiales bacterium]
MQTWSFLTNHARALLFIAQDPDTRLRDIAEALGITERSAYSIVADLTTAGYVVKTKDGRRNRYHIEPDRELSDPVIPHRTTGHLLQLLGDRSLQD